MVQSLFEKLFFKEEKNILVQGLPASIERSFVKIKFSKNVTPLLQKKKIDFALLFAINKIQLERIAPEVLQAMAENGKLWIAFPKSTSKIFSNLSAYEGWGILFRKQYKMIRLVAIDHTWSCARFEKINNIAFSMKIEDMHSDYILEDRQEIIYPEDLKNLFEQFIEAQLFFESLCFEIKKDFILWLEQANTLAQREDRLKALIEKMLNGIFII